MKDMKKYITLFMASVCLLLALSDANSGLLGDVDNDGKVGLTEAINALQITAGVRSGQTASYVITWKGTWATNQNYQLYDAVQFNGSSYICIQNHTSAISNQPPDLTSWNLLALQGSTGLQGPSGDPGVGAKIIRGTVSIENGQIISGSVATGNTFNGLGFGVGFGTLTCGGGLCTPPFNSYIIQLLEGPFTSIDCIISSDYGCRRAVIGSNDPNKFIGVICPATPSTLPFAIGQFTFICIK
jgi:hypothetical protein